MSRKLRLVARLDIKSQCLVKGIQYEGLRKLGNPHTFAKTYYDQGIDEILYLDTVASLYGRNNLQDILLKTTEDIFIPITVGGGLRSVEDVGAVLKAGGDKAAINTAALQNPRLLGEIAHAFGSQCVVLSVQAKRHQQGWEAYYDNGREHSGKDALEWIRQAESLGVGEILVTSVDQGGRKRGIGKELIAAVRQATSLPMIAAGGVGQWEDIASAAHLGAEAVAVGSILHYQKATVPSLKQQLLSCGVEVRPWDI